VLRTRRVLQGILRGEVPTAALDPLLRGVSVVPTVRTGITWELKVAPERTLAVQAVLAGGSLVSQGRRRLRPCANDECRLFLIDRSPANSARWCSMAVCGNRMKARRHYRRQRDAPPTTP
jgi:predicted RNA-binding Zn ribbon-like protein